LDPIKIVIFVGAFLLLLLLMRKLSAAGESHVAMPQPDNLLPTSPVADEIYVEDAPNRKMPATVGADLPFPIQLPEITRDADGIYNRPEFLNYYFKEIDLKTGPANPGVFCDEFFVETYDPGSRRNFTYNFVVATPGGLQQVMDIERLPCLHLKDSVLIVPRWDVPAILTAAVKQIMKAHTATDDEEEESELSRGEAV
jgi:hypothetical protein